MTHRLIAVALLALAAFVNAAGNDRTGPIEIMPMPKEVPDPDSDSERPYYLLVGQAEQAIADGSWQEAADRLVDAMAVEPDNPGNVMLLANLGMAYAQLDRDSLAIEALDRALERAPRMSAIYGFRARVKLKAGRDRDAMTDFGRVLAIDSLNTNALYFHGILSLHTGNLEAAEADFSKLQSIDPDGLDTAVAMATLYSTTSREKEALPYLRRLIAADPSAEYYALMAECQRLSDQLSEATATLTEAMRLFPNDASLYDCRARVKRDMLLYDEARNDELRAARLRAGASRR